MKKQILSVALVILVVLSFSACNKALDQPLQTVTSTNESVFENTIQHNQNRTEKDTSTPQKSDAQTDLAESNVGGAVIRPLKYRARFYSLYYPFVELIGEEQYQQWFETIEQTNDGETMVMLQFVQDFHITREQFDKANLKTAKIIKNDLMGRPCLRPMDYTNQEDDEIYNADIIYTFDEDIINAYYLGPEYPYLFDFEFDEAVAAGDYVSQTEEWIDVDEMEAEILAKYGSLD